MYIYVYIYIYVFKCVHIFLIPQHYNMQKAKNRGSATIPSDLWGSGFGVCGSGCGVWSLGIWTWFGLGRCWSRSPKRVRGGWG